VNPLVVDLLASHFAPELDQCTEAELEAAFQLQLADGKAGLLKTTDGLVLFYTPPLVVVKRK
jgi:hypothetical protein